MSSPNRFKKENDAKATTENAAKRPESTQKWYENVSKTTNTDARKNDQRRRNNAHFATLTIGFVLVARLHQDENLRTRTKISGLAVLRPQMGPDRPNFKSYSHITA